MIKIQRRTTVGRLAFILFALGFGAAPLRAQNARPAPGDRVRVQVHNESAKTFKFKDIVGDTLVLDGLAVDSPGLRMPLASVSRFQVSAGNRPAGTRAVRGAGIGFLSGFTIGAIIGLASGDDGKGLSSYTGSEMAVFLGGLAGGVGLVLGAIVGASSPSEEWKSIPVQHITMVPNTTGGLVIGFRGDL